MINPKTNERELVYVVKVDEITELSGYDRVESARIGGWRCIVPKGQFKSGSLGIYFEIDSRVPSDNPAFAFMEKRNYKVKTQKMCKSISQGLLMAAEDFGWTTNNFGGRDLIIDNKNNYHFLDDESRFLTKELGVTYAEVEDNARKANSVDKYKKMAQRHAKIFKQPWARWRMKREWGRKVMFFFFGKKKDKKNGWPVGRFPGVNKTDQERCENMPWILNDKTPFIKTQKCDGSSGTYILEKIPAKGLFGKDTYEFFVCSRNVRMMKEDQECFYGAHNYYWEVAKNYEIEKKMKEWMDANPEATFVCWQGEICAPGIQKNPHNLSYTHFYCFHWTDSINGRRDIRDAAKDWAKMCMEVVPIVDENYIMPDDFEEFKKSADGLYDSDACEGHVNCAREGFVYYKTDNPNFSFKNVSREYLLNH